MHVHSITIGPIESNCHILVGENSQALVVDPGDEADRILQKIESLGLTVVGYPLTHGHVDHVSALAAVYRKHPAPVGIHPLDGAWAFSETNQIPPFYGAPEAPPSIERSYEDGQTWEDGGLQYEVLFTPGHSPGGVCFHFRNEKVLIAGDTLFSGSVGRTDLPGGDPQILADSLERLKSLPEDTVVHCGHGPSTTLGKEKATNPFMQAGGFSAW